MRGGRDQGWTEIEQIKATLSRHPDFSTRLNPKHTIGGTNLHITKD